MDGAVVVGEVVVGADVVGVVVCAAGGAHEASNADITARQLANNQITRLFNNFPSFLKSSRSSLIFI